MTQMNDNGASGKKPTGDTAIADNPMTEDALDGVIEDSFPASDPPSHTPTTSLGAPKGITEGPEQGRRSRKPLTWAVAGVAAAVVLAGLIAMVLRRRA